MTGHQGYQPQGEDGPRGNPPNTGSSVHRPQATTGAGWTCQRCYRVWSPFTPGCPICNDPEQLKIWLAEEAERQIRHFEAIGKARRALAL